MGEQVFNANFAGSGNGRSYSWMHSIGSTSWICNPLNTTSNVTAVGNWYDSWGFGSLHPGGAHMLFGDGTVRFLSNNSPIADFRAMASIGSGELISNLP